MSYSSEAGINWSLVKSIIVYDALRMRLPKLRSINSRSNQNGLNGKRFRPSNNFNKPRPFYKPGDQNNDRNFNNNSSNESFLKRMPEKKTELKCKNCKTEGWKGSIDQIDHIDDRYHLNKGEACCRWQETKPTVDCSDSEINTGCYWQWWMVYYFILRLTNKNVRSIEKTAFNSGPTLLIQSSPIWIEKYPDWQQNTQSWEQSWKVEKSKFEAESLKILHEAKILGYVVSKGTVAMDDI